MDIQTARGPDAPEDAYLHEDSIEQTAENFGSFLEGHDLAGERRSGRAAGLPAGSSIGLVGYQNKGGAGLL